MVVVFALCGILFITMELVLRPQLMPEPKEDSNMNCLARFVPCISRDEGLHLAMLLEMSDGHGVVDP